MKDKTTNSSSSTKSNPKLWEKVKSEVKSSNKGGAPGQWSARKAQLATQIYKKRGGFYSGKKSKDNSLTKWTKQEWQASDGGNSRRKTNSGKIITKKYLPKKAWENLDPKEKSKLNRSKVTAEKRGKQFSKSPTKLRNKISKYWK